MWGDLCRMVRPEMLENNPMDLAVHHSMETTPPPPAPIHTYISTSDALIELLLSQDLNQTTPLRKKQPTNEARGRNLPAQNTTSWWTCVYTHRHEHSTPEGTRWIIDKSSHCSINTANQIRGAWGDVFCHGVHHVSSH